MKRLQDLPRIQDVDIIYGERKCGGTEMEAYADSGFATCLDRRQPGTGGAVLLAGGAISWFSRMQGTVAAGSTEAECIALPDVMQKVLFLRQM